MPARLAEEVDSAHPDNWFHRRVSAPSIGVYARLAALIGALGTVTPLAIPTDLERLVADIQTPDWPLTDFVYMLVEAADAEVQVYYRCWPEERHVEIREHVHRLARLSGDVAVAFANEPYPAMVFPEPEGHALSRYRRRTVGFGHDATC